VDCPRCQKPLASAAERAGDVPVETLRCPECTGHWVSRQTLRALEEVVEVRLVEWHRLPGVETQGRTLFCPRCPGHKPMDKVVSPRAQKVVMDVCPTCDGVWLDYGEWEAISQKGLFSTLVDVVSFIRNT
jgi:Zn-finger nucleic acid-binding protein